MGGKTSLPVQEMCVVTLIGQWTDNTGSGQPVLCYVTHANIDNSRYPYRVAFLLTGVVYATYGLALCHLYMTLY